MIYCQNCGSQISDNAVFCEKCGAKQEKMPGMKICSNPGCRNEMPDGMVFCDKCGTKYAAPAAETKPYMYPPQTGYTQYTQQPYTPSTINMVNRTGASPNVNTRALCVLSIICIFFFWPVAIYGFVCLSHAGYASTQYEADSANRKGKRACGIAIGIMGLFWMFFVLIAPHL